MCSVCVASEGYADFSERPRSLKSKRAAPERQAALPWLRHANGNGGQDLPATQSGSCALAAAHAPAVVHHGAAAVEA
jgi:hypothetical protein